jgi:hypothetical protein
MFVLLILSLILINIFCLSPREVIDWRQAFGVEYVLLYINPAFLKATLVYLKSRI